MGMPVPPIWTQEDYAFYADGTESGSVIVGSAGAQQSLDVDTIYFCRLAVSDTAGAENSGPATLTCRWQFNLAGGGWTDVGAATALQFANSSNVAHDDTTSNRQPTGTGTFNAGRVYEQLDDAQVVYTVPDDASTTHTEVLLVFQIDSAQVTDGQEILVRCVEGDGTVFGGTYVDADIDVSEAVSYELNLEPDSYALTGVAVTFTRQLALNVEPDSYALTGVAATLIATFAMNAAAGSLALTGAPVTFEVARGVNLEPDSYALSGVDAEFTATRQMDAEPGSYALTGDPVTFLKGFDFNAEAGSYVLTGAPATVTVSRAINAEPGSYALAGVSAELTRALQTDLNSGSYALTGVAAEFQVDLALVAEPGSYALAGVDTEFLRTRIFNAEPDSYALTGVDADLSKSILADLGPGSYALTGAPATFEAARTVDLAPDSYALTGAPVTFEADTGVMNAEPGSYALTGLPVTFELAGLVLDAEPGAYVLAGAPATLLRTRIVTLDPGAYALTGASLDTDRGLIASFDPDNYVLFGVPALGFVGHPVPRLRYFNNYATTLVVAPTDSDTTLFLASTVGLVDPSGSDSFRLTLQRLSDGAIEIVDVTSVDHVARTVACTRGEEGLLAIPFALGDIVECRLTKETLEGLALLGHDHDLSYSQLVHDHDAAYDPAAHNHTGDYEPLDAETVRRNVAGVFTAQQNVALMALNFGANIAWDLGVAQAAYASFTGAGEIDNPTNMRAGGKYVLLARQISGGAITFGSAYDWGDSAPPVMPAAVGTVMVFVFTCDGARMHGSFSLGHTWAGTLSIAEFIAGIDTGSNYYYWPAQETSGSIAEVLQGYNASLGSAVDHAGPGVFGNGNALYNNNTFNAGIISAGSPKIIDANGTGFTISLVFKPVVGQPSWQEGIFGTHRASGTEYGPWIESNGMNFHTQGPNTYYQGLSGGPDSSNWFRDPQPPAVGAYPLNTAYHMVWTVEWNNTFSSANLVIKNLYMNGVPAENYNGTMKNYNGYTLGNHYQRARWMGFSGYNYIGWFAHCMIINDRALTPSQVLDLYGTMQREA